jgi:hypothetical protein
MLFMILDLFQYSHLEYRILDSYLVSCPQVLRGSLSQAELLAEAKF